jgi:small basic protein
MANVEIGAKVSVDTSGAAQRVLELQSSVKKLADEFKNSADGSDKQKQSFIALQQAQGELKKANKDLGDSFKGANDGAKDGATNFGNLKDKMAAISPAAGAAGEGATKFNSALNVLKANPIIAILALLTGIIIGLVNKFKDMDAASDKMSDAWGELSGIFEGFMNKILTPLIDGFVALVGWIVKAAEFIGDKLGVSSKEASINLGKLARANRELDESQAKQAESLATSNRRLQEAREIAGDANVPIRQRIQALKDAAKEEKTQLDNVVAWNKAKLAVQLEQFAQEMGVRDKLIGKIREGSLESLKAVKAELLSMKNVDEAKVQQLSALIIAAEDAGAQSAKIAKKTSTQINSLEKEEAAKREEIRKANADKRRLKDENNAAYEIRMEKLKQSEILLGITDQFEKERKIQEFKLKDDIRIAGEDLKNKKITKEQKIALIAQYEKENTAKLNEITDKEMAAIMDRMEQENEADRIKAEKDKKKNQDDAKKKIEDEKKKAMDASSTIEQRRQALSNEELLLKQSLDNKLISEEEYNAQTKELAKARVGIEKEEQEAKSALNLQYAAALSSLSDVVGKETAVGKSLAIASSLISTYEGIAKGVKLGFPAMIPAIAISAATGFSAVRNILKTKIPGKNDAGGTPPSTPSASVAAPLMPRDNQSMTSLSGQTLSSMNATASRAYVVESDISNSQQRYERVSRAARLA